MPSRTVTSRPTAIGARRSRARRRRRPRRRPAPPGTTLALGCSTEGRWVSSKSRECARTPLAKAACAAGTRVGQPDAVASARAALVARRGRATAALVGQPVRRPRTARGRRGRAAGRSRRRRRARRRAQPRRRRRRAAGPGSGSAHARRPPPAGAPASRWRRRAAAARARTGTRARRARQLLERHRLDDVDAALDQQHAVGGQHGVAGARGEALEGDRVGAGGAHAAVGEPGRAGLADAGDAGGAADVGPTVAGRRSAGPSRCGPGRRRPACSGVPWRARPCARGRRR